MKRPLLVLVFMIVSSVSALAAEVIYRGSVESVYFKDQHGNTRGYTRLEEGLPGTSTAVNEDVWVAIFEHWIVIELKGRKTKIAVPRERVVVVNIGNEEANALNPNMKPNQ